MTINSTLWFLPQWTVRGFNNNFICEWPRSSRAFGSSGHWLYRRMNSQTLCSMILTMAISLVMISLMYVNKCVCACCLGDPWVPCKPFITCNWGSVFPAMTPLTVFLSAAAREGVRAFVWHLSITSGHWGIPLYSLLTMLQAHMFPFTTLSKGTHHPACHYPAPSTTMSPFSPYLPSSSQGKNGLLTMNTLKCGQTWSIVEEMIFKAPRRPPNPLIKPSRWSCEEYATGQERLHLQDYL